MLAVGTSKIAGGAYLPVVLNYRFYGSPNDEYRVSPFTSFGALSEYGIYYIVIMAELTFFDVEF